MCSVIGQHCIIYKVVDLFLSKNKQLRYQSMCPIQSILTGDHIILVSTSQIVTDCIPSKSEVPLQRWISNKVLISQGQRKKGGQIRTGSGSVGF